MKNSYKILLIAILSLFLNGCSLKEEPYGFLSSDQFYKSAGDAYSGLAYCYDLLPNTEYYSRYLYFIGVAPTEEMTFKPDAGVDDRELDLWTSTANNLDLQSVFTNAYMGINRSNFLLEHIDAITMDQTTKNQYKGEAMFLRALHYFNLVRIFGSVPLRKTSVTTSSQISVGLSPMKDIYDYLIDDLLEAEKLTDLQVREGRANKVAVQALLAKVYLQLASAKATNVPKYDFVSNADEYYSKAATYAAKVLNDQSSYTFWTGNLPKLWDVDNQVGNEFIFNVATHVIGGKEEGDWSTLSMLTTPYVDGNPISFGADYGVTIKDGWSHLQTESAFYNSFDPSDKRLTELIISSVRLSDGTSIKSYPNGGLQFPFTLKLIDKNQGPTSQNSGHAIPVIRFSDIALVYAEAAGPTAEAYAWVNKIRNRAGLADLTPGLSVDAFRLKILDERSFELAFEGNRLFDLRRTRQIETVLNKKYGINITDNAATAYYYNIPQREIDNNPGLTQ